MVANVLLWTRYTMKESTAARWEVNHFSNTARRDMMRVLLATDGSEHSERAVDEIAGQHFPADSEVRVISVLETSYFPASLPGEGGNVNLYVEIEKAARERARAAVEKAAARLIVVGSHGHGGFERFLLGSVSQAVALHARCSVEIVRSAKSQARGRVER